jgi:hypothetical protein
MLDSSKKKRLFENIAHRENISSHHLTKSAGRKLQLLISRSPAVTVSDRDELQDICPRVKDEEEEAGEAVLFFDQPTPVIEMKSFLSQKDSATTTPITTTTGSSGHSATQRSAHNVNVFTSHELDDSFDQHILPTHGFGQQHQTSGHQSLSQSESLSTPVVDPNFAPAFSSSHSLTHMDQSALYEPFQMEQAEYVNPHRMLIDPVVPDTPSSGFPLQYADPPQYQRFECPPDQSSHRLLPESVMEIHRPSISSVGPSESSSSSPPASPKGHSDLKRKRSDSESGNKKGRMTKKQQFDALCSRKSQLEEDNFSLKEKVDGYERACRRLKQMLYNRIKQQRA